ncbi:translation initiation factor eIF-2B subunit alpha [Vanrija albida]|uniref:Translation initiation factor eIF2B subunit alpha n=1 Tax=Vanrija albida TaxID=181172 RepID=A0ABR3Q4D1_9TREE
MATAAASPSPAGPSTRATPALTVNTSQPKPKDFDVVAAYKRALADEKYPHPVAAILALVELMEASTASTVSGLAIELTNGRRRLNDSQPSLGVRAGCQLWERFVALSGGGEDFPAYKRTLIAQGRSFCSVTAPQAREKIAKQAGDFLSDDCVVLTHSYSRVVIQTILQAHKQNKRVSVYVTEGRPGLLGMRTHQVLTAAGIPCTVLLDSAVGYVMERVDMVLLGCEAVVESGALVSSVGTYQIALVAKAMQKPVYALAESYKFLRHYPLSQNDLPGPRDAAKHLPLSFPSAFPSTPVGKTFPPAIPPTPSGSAPDVDRLNVSGSGTPGADWAAPAEMTAEMNASQPLVDVTYPDLVDFIITDLGTPLSPTSVSQYLVAQFSA